MSSAGTSWMPPSGRHKVNIGSSLGRALKARRGDTPAAKRSKNIPDRDFYSLRYKFKPSSVDTVKPGSLEVKRSKDVSSITVEHPSTQPNEAYVFKGQEKPSKDFECVLIYDEETGTYTLEKLDSSIILEHPEKRAASPRSTNSPIPALPSTSKGKSKLSNNVIDDDNALDREFEEFLPSAPAARREEEEEEEETPLRSVVEKAQKPRPKQPDTLPPPPAKAPSLPRPPPKVQKAPKKREAPPPQAYLSDAEEEVLEFGRPAEVVRPSPPEERRLELPGSGTSSYAFPTRSTNVSSHLPDPSPPPAAIPSYSSDEEDEEEWEEVAASAIVPAPAPATEEGEFDVDLFESLMNKHLEEDQEPEEDFLAGVVSPEPEPAPTRGAPMSLRQFAGGATEEEEDEYSSSDESDDD